ncbi:MAG: helix-turn-helix transcriptional regulator [Clostridia bacterium]|nr:helix-turn-helix transcriptional regulator [Clostridia bacterium]
MARSNNFGINTLLVRVGDATFVMRADVNSVAPKWREDRNTHLHSGFEIQCLLDGELTLCDEASEHPLKAGDIAIIPPTVFHKSGQTKSGYKRYTCEFLITPNSELSPFKEYLKYNRLLSRIKGIKVIKSEAVISIAKQLATFENINSSEMFNKNISYLSIFLIEIFSAIKAELSIRDELEGVTAKRKVNHEQERQKFIIHNCILCNYAKEDIGSILEAELNMSSRNAARIVKKFYGKTISELVLEARMANAKSLIANTDIPLSEISETVGYKTYVAFFTAFKNYFNVSPKEYKQANKKAR